MGSRLWSTITSVWPTSWSPRGMGLCQRRRHGDIRDSPFSQSPDCVNGSQGQDLVGSTAAEQPPVVDDEMGADFRSTLPPEEACLQSNSEVARAVRWLQRYELSFSDAEGSSTGSLIQVHLLATVLQKFQPLVVRLTPKSELPKNIKKMLAGLPATIEEGVQCDVRDLPDYVEGPRFGVQWAFFEFEFAVMCLAVILDNIKKSCGIVDGDRKAVFLQKVKRAEQSGSLSTGLNSIAQQAFTNILSPHHQRLLPAIAVRSLRGIITTGMSMKLRWTSMSTFIGYFDFETAKEWRLFVRFSAKVCNRLRGNDNALSGGKTGTIPEEETAVRIYEESYTSLNRVAAVSEKAVWWQSS